MALFDLSPAVAAERLVLFLNSHGVGFSPIDLLRVPGAADCAALGYPGVQFPQGKPLAQALRFRTVLIRQVHGDAGSEIAEINEIAGELPWVYLFGIDGVATPVPVKEGLASLALLDLAVVSRAGQWDRIKVCANHACGALFYDNTKAKTRRWHSFQTCGNKANVAAHRQRLVGHGSHAK
ncbi:CGNR zinc finger domain-containing protein [Roseateles chitinivorans]|uniref:CGNR zinc finger domain-containing protein n=1 Tax=Roseateles chitinivorans TaxID=2917965 RepID=UPI003D66A841